MKTTLIIIQIILSIFLSALIFLQSNGENESKSNLMSQPTVKRGWEKIMFDITIFLVIIFVISSIIQILI